MTETHTDIYVRAHELAPRRTGRADKSDKIPVSGSDSRASVSVSDKISLFKRSKKAQTGRADLCLLSLNLKDQERLTDMLEYQLLALLLYDT